MYKQDWYVNETSPVHHLICTQSESCGLQVLVISGEMFIFERQLLKCYCRFNPLPRSVALCFSISSHNQFISRALHAAYHHRETSLDPLSHCGNWQKYRRRPFRREVLYSQLPRNYRLSVFFVSFILIISKITSNSQPNYQKSLLHVWENDMSSTNCLVKSSFLKTTSDKQN